MSPWCANARFPASSLKANKRGHAQRAHAHLHHNCRFTRGFDNNNQPILQLATRHGCDRRRRQQHLMDIEIGGILFAVGASSVICKRLCQTNVFNFFNCQHFLHNICIRFMFHMLFKYFKVFCICSNVLVRMAGWMQLGMRPRTGTGYERYKTFC